jgi:hypothetical protein
MEVDNIQTPVTIYLDSEPFPASHSSNMAAFTAWIVCKKSIEVFIICVTFCLDYILETN